MNASCMVVGLSGPMGCGKGSVLSVLQGRGWECFSLSDVLRARLRERGVEPTRELLVAEGNAVREEAGDGRRSQGALGVAACEHMRRLGREVPGFVVDSIRHPEEVRALREQCGSRFLLLAVDAPLMLRWARCAERGREGEKEVSLRQFVEADDREGFGLAAAGAGSSQCIRKAMALADELFINAGTLEEVEEFVNKWIPPEKDAL